MSDFVGIPDLLGQKPSPAAGSNNAVLGIEIYSRSLAAPVGDDGLDYAQVIREPVVIAACGAPWAITRP